MSLKEANGIAHLPGFYLGIANMMSNHKDLMLDRRYATPSKIPLLVPVAAAPAAPGQEAVQCSYRRYDKVMGAYCTFSVYRLRSKNYFSLSPLFIYVYINCN